MFMRKVSLILLMICCDFAMAKGPELGQPIDSVELKTLDHTVMPDGSGLPLGSGSVGTGEALYQTHCLACHGEAGRGGINDALAGGQGSLGGATPVITIGSYWPYATSVFSYIRGAMPYMTPGSLSSDEVYAVTAYLLHINDIVDEDAVMDQDTLPKVKMPNRGGFFWSPEVSRNRASP